MPSLASACAGSDCRIRSKAVLASWKLNSSRQASPNRYNKGMFCGETARASRSESSLEIMVKSLLRLADKSNGNSPSSILDHQAALLDRFGREEASKHPLRIH